MTNLIGQSIGRYQILEQIGEGGMAAVFKARDPQSDTPVAIKIIRTDRLTRESAAKAIHRFEREGRSLARLNHPNIVRILDFGQFRGYPFLVMEYLPGGTLKQRMPNKPIPWAQAARYLVPVAHALEYAHQNAIIHRDVKPSNILVGAARQPVLSDFGIVKFLGEDATQDLTTTGIMVGTPEYMSPEQAMGEPFDHRVDIYSLGIVFYEMVAGRKPFYADTPVAVLVKQASEPLPSPSRFTQDLPPQVEAVICKALEKKPAKRFQSMSDFCSALESLAADPTTEFVNVGETVDATSPTQAAPTVEKTADILQSTAEKFAPAAPSLPGSEEIAASDVAAAMPDPGGAANPRGRLRWAFGAAAFLVVVAILFIGWRFFPGRAAAALDAATATPSTALAPVEALPATETPTRAASPTVPAPTATVNPPTATPLPVSAWIQSASEIKQVLRWKTGLGGHKVGLDWSPDTSQMLSFAQYQLGWYDIQQQKVIDSTACDNALIEYSRSGSLLLTGGCSLEQSRTFNLWEQIGGTKQTISTSHKASLVDAVLSADAAEVATCALRENNIEIWNVANGENVLTLSAPDDVQDLDYSPVEEILASAHPKNIVILWDARAGEQLRVLDRGQASSGGRLAVPHPGGGFYGAIVVEFSPDGKTLAVGYRDGAIILWEVATGKQIYTIMAHEGGPFDLAFSNDGQALASGGEDAFVRVWNVADGSLLQEMTGHEEIVFSVAFSPDDALLASSDLTGLVLFWSASLPVFPTAPAP
ncbi:MAG: protein kinase [Chloroflexi bacterium]|nr:protein kinase [Chloroflexota bacterium]